MPRYRHIQNSFIGGEISPAAQGRTDLDLYKSSVEDLKNFLVSSKGGAQRRPGTQFLISQANKYSWSKTFTNHGVQSYSGYVRIIPFIFSRTEAYAVLVETDRLAIVNVNTLASATYSHDTSISAGINTFTSFSSQTELEQVQYAQTGDILYIIHPNYRPIIIARTATNTFKRFLFGDTRNISGSGLSGEIGRMVPFFTVNETATTMTIAAGGATLTASTATFNSLHIGAVFKVTSGGATYYFLVQGFTSTTVVTGTSLALGGAGPTTDWEESAFSDYRGWPRTLGFFEQRLYFAGTNTKPDTVWASQIGDIFEFDARGPAPFATPTASFPFSFTAAATEVNQMQWLSPGRSLVAGTAGQEFIAQGSSGALSALDISVTSETNYGSAYRQPVRSENVINFISRNSLTIREFVFNRDQDSFVADDVTRFADHLSNKFLPLTAGTANPEFRSLVKQDAGTIILWALDKNGGLFGLSRDRFTSVNAWSYHVLGGVFSGKAPRVESVASLPSGDGSIDDLWIAVTRTINSSTKTYIERINKPYARDSIINSSTSIVDKALYMDSAKMQQGVATDTITGLSHLEGETVQVIGDGFYLGEFVVSAGQVIVDDPYSEFLVGLKYESNIKSLPIDAGSAIGSSQHTISRVDKVGIRFYNTVGAKFGYEEGDLETILFRKPTTPLNEPVDLFSGDKVLDMPQDYDRRNQVIIKQDLPFPIYVACITLRGVTYD